MTRYVQAIGAELDTIYSLNKSEKIELDTLFLGGGTPSHLNNDLLASLMELIRARFALTDNAEISLEANPADIDPVKIAVLADLGFNRISLGVQSFNDRKLKLLERDHSPSQAINAVELAKTRFNSVSLDLIFGTPGETIDQWKNDLEIAVQLSLQHASTYGLTIEKGTAFWNRRSKGELQLPDEDVDAEMYALAINTLNQAGIYQYEISNFAKPGFRCRHNEVYWKGDPFFALGPGAASYVNGIRQTNHQSVSTYLKKIESRDSAISQTEELVSIEAAKEQLVFGLRRIDGLDIAHFRARTGHSIEEVCGKEIDRLIEYGLLKTDGQTLSITERGIMLFDSIAVELQ